MKKITLLVSLILVGCEDGSRLAGPGETKSTNGYPSFARTYTEVIGCTIYAVEVPNHEDLFLSKCVDTTALGVNFRSGKMQISNVSGNAAVQVGHADNTSRVEEARTTRFRRYRRSSGPRSKQTPPEAV